MKNLLEKIETIIKKNLQKQFKNKFVFFGWSDTKKQKQTLMVYFNYIFTRNWLCHLLKVLLKRQKINTKYCSYIIKWNIRVRLQCKRRKNGNIYTQKRYKIWLTEKTGQLQSLFRHQQLNLYKLLTLHRIFALYYWRRTFWI